MKLAVMQPYFFPYIGYFQLIHAVDKFVIYDDVHFIKQGWIHRNRLLVNGAPCFLTLALNGASSFRRINEIEVEGGQGVWRKKALKTLECAYRKAPHFFQVFPLVESVLTAPHTFVSQIAVESIAVTLEYLNIKTAIVESSTCYDNAHLKGQARVIDICRAESASEYINLSGGKALYSRDVFLNHGIRLTFIRSDPIRYPQFDNTFVPQLSIIDVMMFNPKEKVREFLTRFTLE